MDLFAIFALFLVVFVTDVFCQRRDSLLPSENRRLYPRQSPQWTAISDIFTDGVFPTRTSGRRLPVRVVRPFPAVEAVTTTTAAPVLQENNNVKSNVHIPVSLFMNKNFYNLEDFMKNLGLKNARVDGMATPANCEPQDTPVKLEKPEDPSLVYFPQCTKVQRCGGCCSHDLLMCVPTETEPISVNVMKARFHPESNSYESEGLHPITLEKHLTCECQCRVKAEDCNAMQEYRKEECRCICTNEHESEDCVDPNKFWDPQSCKCACRNSHDCSTGFFFDEHTCTCLPVRTNGVVFPSRKSGLNTRAHAPYEVNDEEVEFVDETHETSPWFISNVMRTRPLRGKNRQGTRKDI